jgi:DnaJ-class molecular chaperone
VRIRVWTPERLSKEQQEILRRLREAEDVPPEKNVRDAEKGFWSRVKEAFS